MVFIFIFTMNYPCQRCKLVQIWQRTSVHKLGGSLTQSSILNVKEGLVNVKHVQSIISMLTTTSTSYILLASLDVARKRLATEGTALIEQTIQLAEHVRDAINSIEHLYCPGKKC